MPDILEQIASEQNTISFTFADGIDPSGYRARLFMSYPGVNDLSGETGTGLYVRLPITNASDIITYDDWDCNFRPRYDGVGPGGSDRSFSVEVVCEFSGDTPNHEIELIDQDGNPYIPSGASAISDSYGSDNLPACILIERKDSTAEISSVEYDTVTGYVTVRTAEEHGFSEGDAVTISGLPRTDHSMGIGGERFNGTYRVSPVSPTSFRYMTRFYPGYGEDIHTRYDNCSNVVATKWITCEYLVDKTIGCGDGEAYVEWPGYTLERGDRIVLSSGGEPAVPAEVVGLGDTVFVCRSSAIAPDSVFDGVMYSPRTPVAEVPANYGSAPNGSTVVAGNTRCRIAPSVLGSFCEGEYASSEEDDLLLGNGRVIAMQFTPAPGMDASGDCGFTLSFRVKSSTEMSAEVLLYEMSDCSWGTESGAEVLEKLTGIVLGMATVSSAPENDCDYDTRMRVFGIDISSDTGKRWLASGRPVGLAMVLYRRAEGELVVPAGSVHVTQTVTEGEYPIGAKMESSMVTYGDTVRIYSTGSGKFGTQAGLLRVSVDGGTDPESWLPVSLSSGDRISFVLPGQVPGGRHTFTVMQYVSGEWVAATGPIQAGIVVADPAIVSLNQRLTPGEVNGTVSYTGKYNRDFGYVGFSEITDDNSLIQNLYSCLLTRKGERLFNRDFGTRLEEMVFSLRGNVGENELLQECLEAITKYEPRITLVYEACRLEDAGPNGMTLVLGIEVPGGDMKTLSIPFKYRGMY